MRESQLLRVQMQDKKFCTKFNQTYIMPEYSIYLRDKGLTKCCDNDVEQKAQPKLTMQAEGDFPLCFTALETCAVRQKGPK